MGHNQSKLKNKNIKNIKKKTNEKTNKLIKTSNNSNFDYTKATASLSEAQKRRLQSELEDSMYLD